MPADAWMEKPTKKENSIATVSRYDKNFLFMYDSPLLCLSFLISSQQILRDGPAVRFPPKISKIYYGLKG